MRNGKLRRVGILIHIPAGGAGQQRAEATARATLSQELANWIDCHVAAFEYYQGSPRLVVPDNPRHANAVNPAFHRDSPAPLLGRMNAIVVDHQPVVDIEFRSVVGQQVEAIFARLLDPEPAGIIDGEPFESLGDAGEAFAKVPLRNVQRDSVDGAAGFQLREIQRTSRPGRRLCNPVCQSRRWSRSCRRATPCAGADCPCRRYTRFPSYPPLPPRARRASRCTPARHRRNNQKCHFPQ